MANGAVIKTKGVCLGVSLWIQGHQFFVDLNVISLGGCDVVLGTQWLSTMGEISWDFKLMTIPAEIGAATRVIIIRVFHFGK